MKLHATAPKEESFTARARTVIRLALPASTAMLSYTLVGVVDAILLGRLGSAALAGVGLANTLLFTLSALVMGLVSAVSPLTAQNEGAGQHLEAGRFLHQATWLALIGGSVLGLILSLGARPLLYLMQPGPEVIEYGVQYLQIRALGLPLFFLTVARDQFLEGLGDTRTPMRVSVFINLLHTALAVWFIFGGLGLPAMGAQGAALSTCLSHAVSLGIYRWVLSIRHRRSPRYGLLPLQRPSRKHLRQMLEVGWPMSIQFFLDVGSWLMLTMFIGWMGEAALAANQIAIRIMSVTFMTVNGVSITATALVGQHLGAGRPELARRYGWTSLAVGVGVMSVIGLTYLLWPSLWIGMFTDDPAVVPLAGRLLAAGLGFQLADTVAMVTFGALKGAGDTRYTMWVSALGAWGVGLPLGYLLALPLGYGPVGVYVALIVQMAVVAAFNLRRFMGDAWLGARLVTTDSRTNALEPVAVLPELAPAGTT